MTQKEIKEKKEKNEKLKNRIIKVVNVCSYILTSIFILTMIISCCSTKKKDNNYTNNGSEIVLNQRDNAFLDRDYYSYGSNIGYAFYSADYQYYDDFLNELSTYVDLSIYWNYGDESEWYHIIEINNLDTYYQIYYEYYDPYDTTLLINGEINATSGHDFMYGVYYFDSIVYRSERITNGFYYMVRGINMNVGSLNQSIDYYMERINFALPGVFNLLSGANTKDMYINGQLEYVNSEGNLITIYDINTLTIDYNNGISIKSIDNAFANGYYVFNNNEGRYYRLMYSSNTLLTCVRFSVLTYGEYKQLTTILIDTSEKVLLTYQLSNFYQQRTSVSSISYVNRYMFNFTSNGVVFDYLFLEYTAHNNPFYWNYTITYGNQLEDIEVLNVDGQPRVNNSTANGIDYYFRIRLQQYQSFNIYDNYNASIQMFQAREIYNGFTFNDIDNSGNLSDSFDIIMLAVTSMLPFLNYYLFPGITIATILLVPLVISLLLFVFKLFKR